MQTLDTHETAHEQARADEQHDRQRGLQYEQRCQHSRPAPKSLTRTGLQRCDDVRSTRVDDGARPASRPAMSAPRRQTRARAGRRWRCPNRLGGMSVRGAMRAAPLRDRQSRAQRRRLASSRLSMSSCEISRTRLTPSAMRTAISRRRLNARARRRLPTFAHAMSRTIDATPSSHAATFESADGLRSALRRSWNRQWHGASPFECAESRLNRALGRASYVDTLRSDRRSPLRCSRPVCDGRRCSARSRCRSCDSGSTSLRRSRRAHPS